MSIHTYTHIYINQRSNDRKNSEVQNFLTDVNYKPQLSDKVQASDLRQKKSLSRTFDPVAVLTVRPFQSRQTM